VRRSRWILALVLTASTAGGSYFLSLRAPQPLWTRVVEHCQSHAYLTCDGRFLIVAHQRWFEDPETGGGVTENRGPGHVWDAATGEEHHRLLSEADALSDSTVSRDSRWLALMDRQRGLTLWDLATGELRHIVATPAAEDRRLKRSFSCRFSPDSRLLLWSAHGRPGI